MWTLRDLQNDGYSVTLYCAAKIAMCSHSWAPGFDQLAQFLGWDFDFTSGRRVLDTRLVCEVCGGRGATVIVQPPDRGTGGSGSTHNHGPGLTDEQRAARIADAEAEFRRLGGRTNAEIEREAKAARQAKAKAEREKARQLIGPPNPFRRR